MMISFEDNILYKTLGYRQSSYTCDFFSGILTFFLYPHLSPYLKIGRVALSTIDFCIE